MSDVLTVADIATHLQVNPVTVRRWLQDKRIPSVMLAGSKRAGYRVTKEAYEKFLDDLWQETEERLRLRKARA